MCMLKNRFVRFFGRLLGDFISFYPCPAPASIVDATKHTSITDARSLWSLTPLSVTKHVKKSQRRPGLLLPPLLYTELSTLLTCFIHICRSTRRINSTAEKKILFAIFTTQQLLPILPEIHGSIEKLVHEFIPSTTPITWITLTKPRIRCFLLLLLFESLLKPDFLSNCLISKPTNVLGLS